MARKLSVALFLLCIPCWAACGSDEEFTCVCTNTLTGEEIERATVVGEDVNDAQEACDDRESIAFPDRCVIEE